VRPEDLAYDLPPDLVAQEPAPRRTDARLLVLDRRTGGVSHGGVADLPAHVRPGDLWVVNDARVLPARVVTKRDTGGRVEGLFVAEREGGAWEALIRSGGRLRAGERLDAGGDVLRLVRSLGEGRWLVEAEGGSVPDVLRRRGRMPLPPYVERADDDPRDALDRERYQTTYARADGAIAAPTAGLHLTPALLDDLRAAGATVATLTLHVGLGTFAPVRTTTLEAHVMHEERYEVPEATAEALARTRAAGGRVVAVGTTTVRALESAALLSGDGRVPAGPGATGLLILPGHAFRVVGALLTNFHLPRSTLLALVAAFARTGAVLAAYREAVARRYRFHSYGDAMFVA
jgi:S-adenosylmethionine:tRNA ribosyltransferase-isomerase